MQNRLSKTVFSGLGFDPVTTYVAAEASGSLFDKIFGPSKEFQARDVVRAQYQELADSIRRVAPDFAYHREISDAIARGANQADLNILQVRWADYQTKQQAAGKPIISLPTTGAGVALAAMPWWVYVVVAGIAATMLLKK